MAEILYESNYYGVSSLGDSLEHHGIKGQKWGIRRFQNPDGSLTALGKQRYGTVDNLRKAYEKKPFGKGKVLPEPVKAVDLEKQKKDSLFERGSKDPLYEKSVALAADKAVKSGKIKGRDDDDTAELRELSVMEAMNENPKVRKNAALRDDIYDEYQKAKAVQDGDVKTILKYAGSMSTQELNEATNRAATIERLKNMADSKAFEKPVNNMSPQEAASKVDSLSTQEINDVLNRDNAKKRLADLIAPAKKERVSALERIQNTANKLSSLGNSIVNAKNTYDRLQEAFKPKEKEPEKSKAEELYDKWLDQAVKTAMADARNKTVGTTKDKEFAAFMTAKNMADGRDEAIKRAREIDKAIGASVEARNIKARKAEAKRVAEAEQARVKAEAKAAALANRKEREAEAERKRKEQERYQAELERIRKQAGSRMWL